MIFLLQGKARSGKDTVANSIISKIGAEKVFFAKLLKDFTMKYFKFSYEEIYEDKTVESRRVMQGIGQFVRDQMHVNFWLDEVVRQIKELYKSGTQHFVISDCRHWNEILEICAAYDHESYLDLIEKVEKDKWRSYQKEVYGRVPASDDEEVVSDYFYDPSYPTIPCISLSVVRDAKPEIEFGANHESEVSLDDFPFEFVMENNGTLEELDRKVDCFLQQLGLEE